MVTKTGGLLMTWHCGVHSIWSSKVLLLFGFSILKSTFATNGSESPWTLALLAPTHAIGVTKELIFLPFFCLLKLISSWHPNQIDHIPSNVTSVVIVLPIAIKLYIWIAIITVSLFVFFDKLPKQNARSLLTPVSDPAFYALPHGSKHFLLHGSSNNRLFQRFWLAV